ncbi:MAG: tRNA preQ1(34) S-adenosylmethionine ribosyltransferase-isomerase QueA [Lacipirellulaceae bacterium]
MATDDPLLFDYDLPRELIAQEPPRNRADARLMVVDRASQSLEHRHFRDLPELLVRGDRLVLNDTQVVPAQLVGRRSKTGGAWRGLFIAADPTGAWRTLCKTRGTLTAGESVQLVDRDGREGLTLRLVEKRPGGEWVAFPEGEGTTDELLARYGRVPLPHYIRDGVMVDSDLADYQTVYARRPGAVAAPTAGLHFTKPLMRSCHDRGIDFTAVTLHVGLGTFRPIQGDAIDEHPMHAEWCELSSEAAAQVNATRSAGGRVIAVGTTSVRTLETAARLATGADAVTPYCGETDLFLRPGHAFRAVDAMITNFHFPRTTLLLLVQALAGATLVKRAYEEAVRERYRFYSYGDAMLVT